MDSTKHLLSYAFTISRSFFIGEETEDTQAIADEWHEFLEHVVDHEDFCDFKRSKPLDFYSHFFKTYNKDNAFSRLLQKILITSVSSADVERSFSILHHSKSKRRSSLSGSTLDAIMRLRINGPKNIFEFPALALAKKWAKKGNLLSDAKTSKSVFADQRLEENFDDWEDLEDEEMNEPSNRQKAYMDGFIFTFE